MIVRNNAKTRKTWIIGRYAKDDPDTKPLLFPPVVPHIDNETHDAIAAIIAAAMGGEAGGKMAQLKSMQAELSAFDPDKFMTPPIQRKYRKLKRDVEALEKEVGKGDDRITRRANREAMKYHLMRGLRAVTTDTRKGLPCIKFTTAPILIRTTVLGTYDFWVTPSGKDPKQVFWLIRRDADKMKWPQGPHPHWHSYGCFGSFGPIFQRMISNHDWGSLVGIFLKYLAIYDPSSPLIRIKEFSQRSFRNETPLA